jgi:hypothetical protein
MGNYLTLADIRAEGITVGELSDDRANLLIAGWEQWFEKASGNFFVSQTLDLYFDGDGSRLLQLPVPIIECTALYINDDFTTPLDSSQYVVYNRRGPVQDDRKNPRIKLKRSSSSSIYSAAGGSCFAMGDQNVLVSGEWGYTESDDSVPSAVSRAILILVLTTMGQMSDSDIDQLKAGRVVEEVTDRHRIQYSDLYDRLKKWAPTGLTEVDLALQMYRAPMRIDAPRNMGLFV